VKSQWRAVLAAARTHPADLSSTSPAGKRRAKAASISPTQRSLKYLRSKGYHCAIVERWNHFAGIRQDLFGIIDIVAIHELFPDTLGIQTTSMSNVSARVEKIKASPYYRALKASHWQIAVHGWGKQGARGKPKMMTLREEYV